MMNERRRKRQILQVDHYDGQCIYSGRELYYELGGYLGGGAAGVVYEAYCARTKRHVAIKILNPVGYKLLPSTLLSRCVVAVRGQPLDANAPDDDARFRRAGNLTPGGSSRFATVATRMRLENVWWLIHPSTKQAVAAYEDPRTGTLRELSLPQCIDVWGDELHTDAPPEEADRQLAQLELATQDVVVKNQVLTIPKIPKKFLKFASTRRSIHREVSHMSGLGTHENVLCLEEALELVQDSKCTTFLVLELAAGGELFDRIKLDCGTDEDTARRYFRQLISGVAFCHSSGVCHRDLKPENLLLADNEEFSTLKIADFGLSAIFAMTEQGSENPLGQESGVTTSATVQAIRRLRSVVGSPHYVAPEVLMDAGQGYDGAKADAWSIGVIVYAMLAGNLPFGKDLLKCLRYEKFKKWCYNTKYSDEDPVDEVAFPTWFFPAQFSLEVKSLITQLLYPDPSMRLSVEEAQRHAWVLGERLARRNNFSIHEEHPEASPPTPSMSNMPAPGNSPSPSPSFRDVPIAAASVSHNIPDQDQPQPMQQRWTPRSVPVSPGGMNRMQLHGRSPTAATITMPPSTQTIPPSPQKAALRARLMSNGYMPSVDETAPLSSGQTPINSPRHSEQEEESSTSTLQFSMDQAREDTSSLSKDGTNDFERECRRHPSFAGTKVESTSSLPAGPTESVLPRASQRKFTSPPLATGSRLDRSLYNHRRNSPPELFLSRFGKGFKFEAIQTAFEDINLEQAQLNLATTPTDSALRNQRQTSTTQSTSSSQSVPNTPLSVTSTPAGENRPPSFQADLVARSTRFITALPAQLVLTKIESILSAYPSLVPVRASTTAPLQRVSIDWENYQLDVNYGDVLTCTVQVFLFQRGVYLVEFRRGQVEIFQFKRFYEDIREKLSGNIELCPTEARRLTRDDDASPRNFPRRRNKSCGVHAELLR